MAVNALTQEETLALITAKAKQNDSFIVKVFRKRHSGGLPESVAILHEAQAMHLVTPEVWLPRLCGGGPIFLLQIFHMDDQTSPIGGYLQVSVPTETLTPKAANEIDVTEVRKGTWNGPRVLVYPTKDERKNDGPLFSIGPSGMPPAPPPGNSAANVLVPGGGQPGALQRDPIFERNAQVLQEIQAAQVRFDRQKEEWLEEQRRQREDLAEQRRRAELEAIRKDSELRMKELEARFSMASQAPKLNIAELLTAVGSVIAPLLVKMAEASGETRRLAADQNKTLMTAMMTRPTMDPVVERVLSEMKSMAEKFAGQQTAPSTMIHSMADAMAAMTSTTMELVQTAADLNLGGGRAEDHPALKAIREGVKAIQSMFQGYQSALPRTPQPQHALPQPHAAAPGYSIVPPPVVHAPPPGMPPGPPHPVPQQMPPPAAPPPGPMPAQASQFPPPRDVLEQLEQMFKLQYPVGQVVDLFIRSIDEPVIQQALDEVEGQIEELFSRRLREFVLANPGHVPYMRALLDEMNRQGEARGIFESDGGEEVDEGEEAAA